MTVLDQIAAELQHIREHGLYRPERVMTSAQGRGISLADGRQVVNFCANDYLGLANHAAILAASHAGLDEWGYGVASVRFICGTQEVHKRLERRISAFLGTEDTILYGSCFDANSGLFETILDERDVVISDALNHASIIDGIRLCKAKRVRYANCDMEGLQSCLRDAVGARRILVATDGVFSMDGHLAPVDEICALADRHGALVMVDDSHAVGVVGPNGRGTPEHFGVARRVDIVTGTLGKALGGASGGYTSGRAEIMELLRQRSRPYLFSNSLAPPIVAASLAAIDLIESADDLRSQLRHNTANFHGLMTSVGFELRGSDHPIVPVMYGDAHDAAEAAERLLDHAIYAIAFAHPVVPHGQARIRVQLSAAHDPSDVDDAVAAFEAVRRSMAPTR